VSVLHLLDDLSHRTIQTSADRRLFARIQKFKMKYLAAYLLLNLAGNESPSAEDIKSILSSVGIDAEGDRLDKLLSELEGKNIQEVRH
jgi:hypothetical protein